MGDSLRERIAAALANDYVLSRDAREIVTECARELERLEREAETREEALNYQCRVADGFRALIPHVARRARVAGHSTAAINNRGDFEMTTAIPWDIDHLTILHGNHEPPNGAVKACAMEVAYLRWAAKQGWDKARIIDEWTDSLECVCPTIGAFVRRWNDIISSDEARTRIFTPTLLDLLPDTRSDDALMLRRMWLAIDWDIRVRVPAFLRLAKLEADAEVLERLPEIDSQERLTDARAVAQTAARNAAAAGDAAGDAVRDAARDAAWNAAWDAAGDAARAAAWDAAGAAARAAARAAAWDAAGERLRPTVEAMQASAVDLLKRMCALTPRQQVAEPPLHNAKTPASARPAGEKR